MGNTAEAIGGCQPKHQPTAGPKVGGGGEGGLKEQRRTGSVCQGHNPWNQALYFKTLTEDYFLL